MSSESKAEVTIEDLFRDAEQMNDHYNPVGHGEHPVLTRDCWRHEVLERNTISGYWDWVVYELKANLDVWAEDLNNALEKVTEQQMHEWIIEDYIEAIFEEGGETYMHSVITEGLPGLKNMTYMQLLKDCYDNGLLARHDIIEE